jgi:hypothetical protein
MLRSCRLVTGIAERVEHRTAQPWRQAPSPRALKVAFVAFLLAGLALRVSLLQFKGGSDMDTYVQWGHLTSVEGLARGYQGIYFPAQYQLFALADVLATHFGQSAYTVIKVLNLVADIGMLAVVSRLLSLWRVSLGWSLVYWLNPLVLVEFALGYSDFQWSLFVLAAVWILTEFRGSPASYVAAGTSFGGAVMMKPQALAIAAMIGTYVVVSLARKDLLRWWLAVPVGSLGRQMSESLLHLALLIMPGALFVAYSVYFALNGFSLSYLARTYRADLGDFPSLTAHMLNIWYPVAYVLRQDGEPIWMVTGPKILHVIAAALTALAFAAVATYLARFRPPKPPIPALLPLASLASLLFPMLFTQAHENHLFLGCIFSVLLMALVKSVSIRVGLSMLTGFQAFNLFAIYGLGNNVLSNSPFVAAVRNWYQYPIRDYFSILAVVTFAATMVMLAIWWKTTAPSGASSAKNPLAAPADL